MKSQSATTHAAPAPKAVPRRPYSTPVLRIHGCVSKLTQGGNGSGVDGGGAAMTMVSDRNAKQNIVRIGEHPMGFGLYLFDYRPELQAVHGAARQFGVLADEVQEVMPSAVSLSASGYLRVDYAMLGIAPALH